ELLGAAAEPGTPQLVQQMTQLVVLLDQTIALGNGAADQRAQRFDIVGKGIGQRAHKAYRITSLVSLSAAICAASRFAAIPSGEIRADAHCTAFGRMIRGTCTRDQSSPSSSAASCAGDSRISPFMIGGQRNAPSSSRLLISIRPV